METVLCSISLSVPHKVRIENCKGFLADPRDQYTEFAYWHGRGKTGWYSKPYDTVDYIPCINQQLSQFEVEAEVAERYKLR